MSSKSESVVTNGSVNPALVPKLRFPEFREAEGWSEKPLQAVAKINPANDGLPEFFVYIDLESVESGELKVKTRISKIGAPSRAQRLIKSGDIVYQVVRPYQRNNLLCDFDDDEDYVASTGYAQLRAIGSNHFLYQSIHTDSFVGKVIEKCTGSNYPAINSSDLGGIELPLPPTLAEQQKIANCLSSLDELIAAQARKVDALKTHKKGLMQQLFPREGETQPRLRFYEFRNGEEWGVATLADACRMQAGKFVAAADILENNTDELFPCYGGNGLRGFTAKYTHEGDYPLIGRQGALCGNIKFASGRFYATEHAVVATPDHGVEVVWLYYVLDLLNLNRFATGQAQPGLSVDVLEKVPVKIPRDKGEQQRIASCLSSVDALITLETQKLETLKTHKKGLMQQLFPSPDEATA